MKIHCVWIGAELTLLEQLTIKLYQCYGYTINLWLYKSCRNVPTGVQIRPAESILPYESVFTFESPAPHVPKFGLGSPAHWAEQFQLRLLQTFGGYWTQLDVAPLAPLDFPMPYVIPATPGGRMETFLMKCPQHAPFIPKCLNELRQRINTHTCTQLRWADSVRIIDKHLKEAGLQRYYLPARQVVPSGAKGRYMSVPGAEPPASVRLLHWSNAGNAGAKEHPKPETFYAKLLSKVGLI